MTNDQWPQGAINSTLTKENTLNIIPNESELVHWLWTGFLHYAFLNWFVYKHDMTKLYTSSSCAILYYEVNGQSKKKSIAYMQRIVYVRLLWYNWL